MPIRERVSKALKTAALFNLAAIAFAPSLFAQTIDLGKMQAQYSRPNVVFFPDGQSFAIAADKSVRTYRLDGTPIKTYASYLNVKGLAISPDGSQLATAESDDGGNVNGLVKVVDVKTGRLLRQFRHRAGYAEWLSFSPDGRYLASVGDEPAVYVWDLRTGRPAARMEHHKWGNVSSVHFSRDGKYLFSGGQYRDSEALLKADDAENRYYNKTHTVEAARKLQEEIQHWYETFNESWKIGEFFIYSTTTWNLIKRIQTPGAVHGIQSVQGSEKVTIVTNMDRQQVGQEDGYLLSVDLATGTYEELDRLPHMPDDFADLDSEHRFYYRHNYLGYSPTPELYVLSTLDGVFVLDDDLDEEYSFDVDSDTVQSPVPAAISPDGTWLVTLEYSRETGAGQAIIRKLD
ncbi:MAG: hypothetical protein CMN76_04190 [Spirochaetaceae bacterium]|nr:hypothetical protein [Spirochaetaceae bacterium]|tara:strand:+ start:304430 stop:305638 length:1209 start_codon:yes stop_codon:yes gene_type:complete